MYSLFLRIWELCSGNSLESSETFLGTSVKGEKNQYIYSLNFAREKQLTQINNYKPAGTTGITT